jgi:hypothetical protein
MSAPSSVMPAQRHPAALRGGDPVFPGISILKAQTKTWMAGTSLDEPGHDSE